jgi:hypothetical protein
MNDPTVALQALKSLEGLHADLVRAERSMPTAPLRAEIARLAAAVKRSSSQLLHSQQVAAEVLGAKREKNAALAAKNAAAIKQAKEKLKQPASPPAAETKPLPPIDPELGGILRDELLDRFAPKVMDETKTPLTADILSDWQWTDAAQSPASI